jgi:hypothetical protein
MANIRVTATRVYLTVSDTSPIVNKRVHIIKATKIAKPPSEGVGAICEEREFSSAKRFFSLAICTIEGIAIKQIINDANTLPRM